MPTNDAMTVYAVSMGTLIVFLLVWLVRRQKTARDFSVWLASGVAGILLGSAGSYAIVMASGHVIATAPQVAKSPDPNAAPMGGMAPPSGPPPAHSVGGPSGTPGGAVGVPGAPGGGGMMMGGGGRGPNPKRDLTTLVRKLNLLTDDVALKLNSDQTMALVKGLSGVDNAEKFSDDDAKKVYEELFAVLTDDQKTKLDAIGLPFGGRGGGGGGGGGGGMGGGRGAPPDPDLNPFKQENNLDALKSLRARFDGRPPSERAEF